MKEVLKFDAKPQYEQHTLSIFLKHWKCQLLVQNMVGDLQELFTEFLHNIPKVVNNPRDKMKFTVANKFDNENKMALEWNNFRLPKEKHLFVPTMLYFLIFLKNVGERKEKEMEENFLISKHTQKILIIHLRFYFRIKF